MAVANWTLDQVFNQLNSRERWSSSTITFSFPQTASGMAYFTGLIQDGTFTQASLALLAAEHPLNLANIGWVELVGVGVGCV